MGYWRRVADKVSAYGPPSSATFVAITCNQYGFSTLGALTLGGIGFIWGLGVYVSRLKEANVNYKSALSKHNIDNDLLSNTFGEVKSELTDIVENSESEHVVLRNDV
jgi:hypothetical protein